MSNSLYKFSLGLISCPSDNQYAPSDIIRCMIHYLATSFHSSDIDIFRFDSDRYKSCDGAIIMDNDYWDERYLESYPLFDQSTKPIFMIWYNFGINTWKLSNASSCPKNVYVFNINQTLENPNRYTMRLHNSGYELDDDYCVEGTLPELVISLSNCIAEEIEKSAKSKKPSSRTIGRGTPSSGFRNFHPNFSQDLGSFFRSPWDSPRRSVPQQVPQVVSLVNFQVEEIVNRVANAQLQALIHFQQVNPESISSDVSKRLSNVFQRLSDITEMIDTLHGAVNRIESTVNQNKQTNLQILSQMDRILSLLANKDEVTEICNSVGAAEKRLHDLITDHFKIRDKEPDTKPETDVITPATDDTQKEFPSPNEFDVDTYLLTISEIFTKSQLNVELDLDYFAGPNVSERVNLLKEFVLIFLKDLDQNINIPPLEAILLNRLRVSPSTVSWMGTSLKVREIRTYKDFLSMKKTGVYNRDKFTEQKWFQSITRYLNLAGVKWKKL